MFEVRWIISYCAETTAAYPTNTTSHQRLACQKQGLIEILCQFMLKYYWAYEVNG